MSRRAGLVFLLQVKGVQKFGTPRSLPRKSYRAFAAAAPPLTGASWRQWLHVIGAGGDSRDQCGDVQEMMCPMASRAWARGTESSVAFGLFADALLNGIYGQWKGRPK